jgi:hypothetical protein
MKRLIVLGLGVVLLTSAAPLQPTRAEGSTVDIIHKGRDITVSLMALPWHLLHGDKLPGGGPCEPPICTGG